ncbi:hypothetical protein SAMN04488515_0638 [Cognatiyoonia koreensis]|uniref:Transferrin-binding protein B C-lobe/N-lobe beta barrel domain-containing protein n=1 Tax=Cognatiyoonia koreensis TaxID=364200 RepID=A0A1I0NI30_9RHOB|nr:hypothetical protein [Cognatiyoonia koreensis]SEW01157.1 hypothetical protein SAMN04488515_0638 [Cognatiyoonia koreensis]
MSVARFGKVSLAALAAFSFAACSSSSNGGGSGGGVAGAENPMAELEEIATRVDGYSFTRFDAVPTTGDATFTGLGGVQISDADGVVLSGMGDVSVTVDFGTEAVSGGLTNITGYTGTAAEVAAATAAMDDTSDISGELSLSRGDIFTLRPNAFGVDYDGTLGADGYVVDGRALGEFKGTRSAGSTDFPIRAVQITDDDGVATIGAETFDVEIGLFGETE